VHIHDLTRCDLGTPDSPPPADRFWDAP